MRRSKGEQMGGATKWALGLLGFQYTGDAIGKRVFDGSVRENPFHGQHGLPPLPALGHSNLHWLFNKLSDVSVNAFTRTEVGSGTQLVLQDELGGVAKFTNGAADDDYQMYFSIAECLQIPNDCHITWRTKIRIADVDQADMFVGYCETLGSGNLFDDRVDCVGFYLTDGSPIVKGETKATTGSQTSTGITLEDNTWVELLMGIECISGESFKSVNFFVNGLLVKRLITTIPTDAMKLAFGLRNGQAVANSFSITTTIQLNALG